MTPGSASSTMSSDIVSITVGSLKANLPILSTQAHYRTWAQTWQAVLMGSDYWSVVTDIDADKETRPKNVNEKASIEIRNYDKRNNSALAAILAGVSTDLQRIVASFVSQHESARLAWKALKDKYDHETTISTLELFNSLVELKMNEGDIISDHISNFETTYSHIYNRCSESSREEAQHLKLFLGSDSVKTMSLLRTLPLSFENVVDNLMSKDRVTFADVNKRLLDIQSSRSSPFGDSKAYFMKDKPSYNTKKKEKECSWCKSRNKKYLGHRHSECRQLKAFKESEERKHDKEKAHAVKPDFTETDSVQKLEFAVEKAFVSRSSISHPWILDSGTSTHMSPFKDDFSSLSSKHGTVETASGSLISIHGSGKTEIDLCLSNHRIIAATFDKVLFVPGLGDRLLSESRLEKDGFYISSCNGHRRVLKNDEEFLYAKVNNSGQYIVQTLNKKSSFVSYLDAHEALGHPGTSVMSQMRKIDSSIPKKPESFSCTACLLYKSKHKVPKSTHKRASIKFDLIHSDLSGRFSVKSLGGKEYYITFIDDYTRHAWIYYLKHKSDAFNSIKQFVNMIKTQFGTTIKVLQTDNGGEYVNSNVEKYLAEIGIIIQNSPSYSHESNGIAERFNQTIITKARTMLMDHGKFLWAEAISMAVYLYNRLPHRSINGQSPLEALTSHPFTSTTHLRPFGSKAFVHIPVEARTAGSKLMPRALEGILVGYTYSSKIFRIYIPSKRSVIVSRQVVFSPLNQGEVSLDIDTLNQKSPTNSPPPTPSTKKLSPILSAQSHRPTTLPELTNIPGGYFDSHSPLPSPVVPNQSGHKIQAITTPGPRRGTRERRQPDRYGDFMAHVAITEPTTHKQAMIADDAELWKEAIDEEMDALRRNNTWDIVTRPKDRAVVGSRWVFKVKHRADGSVDRYKARLVAKGFSQIPGTDFEETYAPVARFDSLRLLLALAAHNNWNVHQMDVKSAFLYGKLDRDLYMEIPDGFKEPHKVYKLRKCIYGLKQSPLVWYSTLKTALTKYGFVSTNFDPCVFVHNKTTVYIAVYVDDILISGSDPKVINGVRQFLHTEFECKDLGQAHFILGIEVEITPQGISLSQHSYFLKVLKRFGMLDCHPVGTPLEVNSQLKRVDPADQIDETSTYQSLIGSLMYGHIGTRPDLAFPVTHLSQFSSCPGKIHLAAAKRVLRYLKGTIDMKLFFPRKHDSNIHGYADSSWGNNLDDRKSYSGYVFRLGEASISWCSQKQKAVALSSTEAEYMAICLSSRHMIWLTRAIKELRQSYGAILHADSTGAIDLSENNKVTQRSKHIDIQYHFIRSHVGKDFEIEYLPSSENLADLLTKALPKSTHEFLSKRIMMQS